MTIKLKETFEALFGREAIRKFAKETGAVSRERSIDAFFLCLALVGSAMGDEQRSIATARRLYGRLSGFAPEESSFYERFHEGLSRLMKTLFERAIAATDDSRLRALSELLGGVGILEMIAFDGSQIALPSWAKEEWPSTQNDRGGAKLTAFFGVLRQKMTRVGITDARTHDRRALMLPRWLHGVLLLFDKGYHDYKLFAIIEDRKGAFLSRLKRSARPRIRSIRCGLTDAFIGSTLDPTAHFEGTVDVMAAFPIGKKKSRLFRVVRVIRDWDLPLGADPIECWLVTSLPAESFTPEQIVTLYRFRWQVESLFHILKAVARLDHLRSGNQHVIKTFIYAALLGVAIADQVTAEMREAQPNLEPSPHRVATLVLLWLPTLMTALGTATQDDTFGDFNAALWREGVNPNPGRPYKRTLYTYDLYGFEKPIS
jgi:hypothetical protein